MSGALPNGWTEVALSEVCSSVAQSGPSSDTSSFRYIDLGAIDNSTQRVGTASIVPVSEAPSRARQRVAAGDVLFSTVRVYLENIALVPPDLDGAIASTAFAALRPGAAIEPRFLYRLVTSKPFIQAVNSQQRGNSPPSVQEGDVRGQRVPLPPKAEQQRIVSRIEELFSEIDEGERALGRVGQLVERYRQSVLKAAVTGELTREWREARTRHEAASSMARDTSDAASIPVEWEYAALWELGEFGRGKSKHRPRNDPRLYGGRYPFLQTGTVRASQGLISTFDSTYSELGLAQSKLWPKGTVCITIAANIAESGILGFDACFPDSIVGLVPGPRVLGEFVEMFIRTARESLDRFAPATAQKNINLDILEKVRVPLPPLREQEEICSRARQLLARIGSIDSSLAHGRAQSSALRQSILKAAFSGQLVPQDPRDEPASSLLARLAAQAAEAPAAPRRRGRPAGLRSSQPNPEVAD
jgi:type I restriction enzyme, S subunit